MKPHLGIALQAQQKLSARQYQQIHFLQLSAAQLGAELQTIVANNWVLDGGLGQGIGISLEQQGMLPNPEPTLFEHLLAQLPLHVKDKQQQLLVKFLIHSLDEDGYLRSPLKSLQSALGSQTLISLEQLQMALTVLQQFDPPGVGARSLAECWLLQLQQQSACNNPIAKLAHQVCTDHWQLLVTQQNRQLQRSLGINQAKLAEVLECLKRLDSKPNTRYYGEDRQDFVVAELLVNKQGRSWSVQFNHDTQPNLFIDQTLVDNLSRDPDCDQNMLKQHVEEAKQLLGGLQSRKKTLLQLGAVIVKQQAMFFDQGPAALRPLKLEDLAHELGLHVSTVSRLCSNKYMHTPHGTLALQYFLTQAAGKHTDQSAKAVSLRLQQIIAQEPGDAPYSDAQLVEMLRTQGVSISRRTVSKYREALGIPSSYLRKR